MTRIAGVTARDRKRLQRAHENGYLDMPCKEGSELIKAYGLWCWRLKVPMVWFERRTARSKYGRVHLDMFTTPYRLSGRGKSAVEALGATGVRRAQPAVSPHDARLEWVAVAELEDVAERMLRSATKAGNYELHKPKIVAINARRLDAGAATRPVRVASA